MRARLLLLVTTCCAACHRSEALRSLGTHFRHEVRAVDDAGPGTAEAQPVASLDCASLLTNREEIADLLRTFETCHMDRGRQAGSISEDACTDFDESASPLNCVHPWELPPSGIQRARSSAMHHAGSHWTRTRPTFVGSFKPGQMLMFNSKPVGIASSSNAEKTVPADLAVEEAIMFVDGELLEHGVYWIDFKRLRMKPIPNQPDLAHMDTAVSVSLGLRLYFSTGLHHAVVLGTSRGSADHDEPHGLLRFVSFWFEMKPNELEFHATGSEHGAELHRPVASKSSHYGRDLGFVTCCSAWGGLHYHTDFEHAAHRHISDGDRYHKGPSPSRDNDYIYFIDTH